MPNHKQQEDVMPSDVKGMASLYTHTDPLAKRLRLEDPYGRPIDDARRAFLDKDLLVFFVGSAFGDNNLKQLHHDLIDLQQRQYKHLQVIYTSVDSSPDVVKGICQNKPYVRMTLHDSSDFAPMATSEQDAKRWTAEVTEIARNEDFVTAEELESGAVKVQFSEAEEADFYARPLSRSALCHLTKAYATPSIAIYHIPSHNFIATGVRPSAFRPDRIDRNVRNWRAGGLAKWGFVDVWENFRFPIVLAIFAVLYNLAVFVLGEEYNVIPQIMNYIQGRRPTNPLSGLGGTIPRGGPLPLTM